MSRYYYQNPIITLYMMKEFGVKFVNPQPVKDNPVIESNTYSNLSILVGDLEYIIKRFGKVAVCEESEHIFEPKIKDFAKSFISDVVGEIFSKSPYESRVALARIDEEEGFIYRDSEIQIIMRDNKHFFMPEVEND